MHSAAIVSGAVRKHFVCVQRSINMTMTLSPARYALSVCAAAAILAGCGGGSTSPSYQPFGMSQTTRAQSLSSAVAVHDASCQGQRSFQYIGHAQRFEVPRCATTIYVDAKGASGEYGGDGGEVDATIPVTPRETLIVIVGGAGHKFNGGFNGGAAGAREIIRRGRYKGRYAGAGGGGASDVRQGGSTLADRVVVAGGGGGEDNSGTDPGIGGKGGGLPDGGGGGTPGCNFGTPTAGGGGTQSSGGTGGAGSNGGSLGKGGVGVSLCLFHVTVPPISLPYLSSGGGGGYYGGGGGGAGGAGGGGSGYAEPTSTNVSSKKGVNSGNGSALICWGYSNKECGTHEAR
jgi:hypothetical protein